MIPLDLLILVCRAIAFQLRVLPDHLCISFVFLLFLVEGLEVFSGSITSGVVVQEESGE